MFNFYVKAIKFFIDRLESHKNKQWDYMVECEVLVDKYKKEAKRLLGEVNKNQELRAKLKDAVGGL